MYKKPYQFQTAVTNITDAYEFQNASTNTAHYTISPYLKGAYTVEDVEKFTFCFHFPFIFKMVNNWCTINDF